MKIAAAAYPIDWLDSWDAYAAKLERWVAEAQADLLVFPEYGAMELASLAGREAAADLDACTQAVSDLLPEVDALHARLASRYGCHIVAASAPVATSEGFVNRARLISPDGGIGIQDKQIMTRWEREPWGILPGGPLRVFETALGRIGILICYDSEFPLLARALFEAGVEILLVPSCTETLSGYSRVRIGAMARALEGQCVAAHSSTLGDVPWCPPVEANTGMGGIFGPPDNGMPPTGILAEGTLNRSGWTTAEVDIAALREIRRDGQVLNLAHWPEQSGRITAVEAVTL
ncbi:carbon-nitrogen hydrolase family protein [Algicella marina]|uniref:Amidohydrolase n=1 Tax=Algicella marina TaxID=2683284 RepID=A0A6P1T1K9_9RHOB|nr:carbon-nitrogen hydrolase family protein [Algicella marina]QHQ35169.1 amidohydrolase [Algicella marina]